MEILTTTKSKDYELLDSGEGQKLERYGSVVLLRPDPQALWSKSLSKTEWEKADAIYTRAGTSGKWNIVNKIGEPWEVTLEGLKFFLELLPSKHLGVFPEQSMQWKWLEEKIKKSNRKISVLNLFGYTGGASLACAKVGAEVCHVDASRFAVDLAHKNMELSGLKDKKIRFIVDDVRKFVEREIKRGNKYDVVLMDPPVYGKGSKGETWKIEEDLRAFLSRVKQIISDKPLAIVLNGYSSVYSSVTYSQLLDAIIPDFKGEISSGELTIKESSSGRLLPCGIFARWSSR
ncbi:MAG: class I SAM-dependent methyltransferase [Minisyncoccia bacterium]